MVWKLFAVRDSKAELFLQPAVFRTVGEAVRAISDLVNKDGHNFNTHSEDYSLFEIGTYDESSGVLTSDVRVVGLLINYRIREV